MLQEELIQSVDMRLDGFALWRRQVELLADGLQQLHHRELGVEDVGHYGLRIQVPHHGAQKRRFPSANLAGNHHHPAAFTDAEEQVTQGFLMVGAQEQVIRVRSQAERIVMETVEFLIHTE